MLNKKTLRFNYERQDSILLHYIFMSYCKSWETNLVPIYLLPFRIHLVYMHNTMNSLRFIKVLRLERKKPRFCDWITDGAPILINYFADIRKS